MTAIEVAEKFYSAFSRLDAETMASCYSDQIDFSDPVFPSLSGARAANMWRMLCSRSPDLKVTYKLGAQHGNHVHVHWEARYPFSLTGRPVHNIIEATLTVEKGLIVRHRDQFNFWRWSRQALGPKGLLLGWTPLVSGKVRAQAAQGLALFEKRKSGKKKGD